MGNLKAEMKGLGEKRLRRGETERFTITPSIVELKSSMLS